MKIVTTTTPSNQQKPEVIVLQVFRLGRAKGISGVATLTFCSAKRVCQFYGSMLKHEPPSADLSDFASIGQHQFSCWIERKDNLPQSTSLPSVIYGFARSVDR